MMRFSYLMICFHFLINKAWTLGGFTHDPPLLPLQTTSIPPSSPPPPFLPLSSLPSQNLISPYNSSFLAFETMSYSYSGSFCDVNMNLLQNSSLEMMRRSRGFYTANDEFIRSNTLFVVRPPPVNSLQSSSSFLASPPSNSNVATNNFDQWPFLVMGGYIAMASATLQALQNTAPLTTTSKFVYMAMVISVLVLVVAVFLRRKNPRVADRAVLVGSLSAIATFLVALVTTITR